MNAAPRPPAVELEGIAVHYGDPAAPVLDVEQLTIAQGEHVAVVGPSGSGKTTLLRLVNGYVRPARGRLRVLGEAVDARAARRRRFRRRIGLVFQRFNLVERACAFDNVLWGRVGHATPLRGALGTFGDEDKAVALAALDEVGLGRQAAQRCDTLSGGQQQRVAIARTLAQNPEIILADEPVSSLDPALADDILGLLVRVSRQRRATLVLSLHQPELARRYTERIVGLREGKVVWDQPARALDDAAIEQIYGRQPVAA